MEGNRFFPEAIRSLLSSGYAILCKTESSVCLKKEKTRVLFDRTSGKLLCKWEANFPAC
jgi:hypothetical protein